MPRLDPTVRAERDGALNRVDRARAAVERAERELAAAAFEAVGRGCSKRSVVAMAGRDWRTLDARAKRSSGADRIG